MKKAASDENVDELNLRSETHMAKQMRIRKSLHQILGRLRNFLGPVST